MGNWAAIRLRDAASPNRDAIGAWVELRIGDQVTQREVTVGGGHAGGQLGWIHLGLGPADRAEVRILWPDGASGPWMPVDAGTFAIVDRAGSAVEPWMSGHD